ncbi:hypothetical protein DK419_16025 [Methylobacterium terrae]|uniref:Uncharacterized protein n=1 Tax=Methylobacterium terrae TaxID=2202827 RepID=A0A2U8WNI2_9HYPH|nr:hypothetical protein DK419_16025 [Methylobacterium terrae]
MSGISLDVLNRLEEETSELLALADLVLMWWMSFTGPEPSTLPLCPRDRRKLDFALGEIYERARRISALLDPR